MFVYLIIGTENVGKKMWKGMPCFLMQQYNFEKLMLVRVQRHRSSLILLKYISTVWRFPKKLNEEQLNDLVTLLLNINQKKLNQHIEKH